MAMPVVRGAGQDDVVGICRFGETHVRPHYTPLIGAAAADEQVRRWWNEPSVDAAVVGGLVVVAEVDGDVVGVGQRGRRGTDHVVYKLYVDPGIAVTGWECDCSTLWSTSCPLTSIGCM